MNKIINSDKIYISKSKMSKAGRGVFARNEIKKGETIERCPVIEIPKHDTDYINQTQLVTYIYYLGKTKARLTLVLGFGSIYNHAYSPNAMYKEKLKEKIVDFIAIKEINKDEEITVKYTQGHIKNKNPLWFEVSLPPRTSPR